MEIIIGLIIIAIGSFCQSSSYVPIKKVKEWSWESFWLIQGVFAWLVFPLLGALLGIPQGGSLFDCEAIIAGIDCGPHLQWLGGPVDAIRCVRTTGPCVGIGRRPRLAIGHIDKEIRS